MTTPVHTRSDRDELVTLRVTVARVAQAFDVQSSHLPVVGKQYCELHEMAETNERGWNMLCAAIVEAAIINAGGKAAE
jgi:hypothetical protein